MGERDASCRVCGADRDADESGTRLPTFVEILAEMRQELRALAERLGRLEREAKRGGAA
jgi:hypothetical protein